MALRKYTEEEKNIGSKEEKAAIKAASERAKKQKARAKELRPKSLTPKQIVKEVEEGKKKKADKLETEKVNTWIQKKKAAKAKRTAKKKAEVEETKKQLGKDWYHGKERTPEELKGLKDWLSNRGDTKKHVARIRKEAEEKRAKKTAKKLDDKEEYAKQPFKATPSNIKKAADELETKKEDEYISKLKAKKDIKKLDAKEKEQAIKRHRERFRKTEVKVKEKADELETQKEDKWIRKAVKAKETRKAKQQAREAEKVAARKKDYKSFIEESSLDAKERYGREEGVTSRIVPDEGPSQISTSGSKKIRERPPVVTRERTDTLEDLGREAYRKQDYEDFRNQSQLNALGPPQISTLGKEQRERGPEKRINTLDELGSRALPVLQAQERAAKREAGLKHGGVGAEEFEKQIQRRKAMVSGDKYKPEHGPPHDPFGPGQYREEVPPSVGLPPGVRARIEAGDPELVGERDVDKVAAMDMADTEYAIDKEQKEKREQDIINAEYDFPTNQTDQQAQAEQAIREMPKADQDAVMGEIALQKGPQSEEHIAAKEATGRYVRYAGSGFVINKSSLEKLFDRKEKMNMLKYIPEGRRAAMLAHWNLIDPSDLSVAQKQSAKEIKELTLLDLKIAEVEERRERTKGKLDPEASLKYREHSAGFRKAVSDGDWETAEFFHNQMNGLLPSGSKDVLDFNKLKTQQQKKLRKLTPLKIFQNAGLKDGSKYYASIDGIMKHVNQIKKSSNKGSEWDRLMGQSMNTMTGEGSGTYGEFLKTQGIYSWKKVRAGAGGPGAIPNSVRSQIPEDALVSEEAYMSWALPQIQNKLAKGIWGSVHTQIQDRLGILEKRKVEEAEATLNNPPNVDIHPAQESSTTPESAPAVPEVDVVEPTALTGSPEEMQEAIDAKSKAVRDKDIAKMEELMKEQAKGQSVEAAKEMQKNFESVVQEIGKYDIEELNEALSLQEERLKKAIWDKRGEPEQKMISQTIEWIRHKLRQKGQ